MCGLESGLGWTHSLQHLEATLRVTGEYSGGDSEPVEAAEN